jgi:6-phosphogluconolactonase (cycloisomerase 2 family)
MTATPETVFPELAYCRIRGGISATDTDIPIYPGDASNLLPAWTSGQVFYMTITDAENHIEVVKVTDIKLKSLTVERGQDSTVARQWYDGAMMTPRLNAALLDASLQQETERQVAFNPNGVLTPLYRGEKVFQSGPSDCEKRWFKSVEGTKWRLIAGAACPLLLEYFEDGYLVTPELTPDLFTISYLSSYSIMGGDTRDIFTDGNFIFAAESSYGVRVYSFIEGSGITLLDSDLLFKGLYAIGVWYDGTFLYVATADNAISPPPGYEDTCLCVYTIDELGALTLKDSIVIAGEAGSGIWADDNFVYLSGGISKALYTFSVDELGQITAIDSSISASGVSGGEPLGVWGDGNFIYVACKGSGIKSFSVDESGNITDLYGDDQGGLAYDVYGDGTYVYLANGDRGIEAYTVDEVGQFTHVDRYDPGGQAWSVTCVSGLWVLVANLSTGFYADYMDETLQVLNYYNNKQAGFPTGICSNGTYVFVSNANSPVIDVYKIELT